MDDIVWIRDDAPDDDSTPVPDQPPSENVPSTIAAQNANEEPETFIEIPVTFQPKSTEVRFYNNFNDDSSKNGEREGAVPVEVYQPFSTSNEHPTTNGSQLGQRNGQGNAIVISLLFRGQDNGTSRKETAEPPSKLEEVVPHEAKQSEGEESKTVEIDHLDQTTAGGFQSQKDETKPSETIQASTTMSGVPIPPASTPERNQETFQLNADAQQERKPLDTIQPAAEQAVINLTFKEPPPAREEPQKPPETKEPAVVSTAPATTAAEPAVINLVYKDPSEKREETQKADREAGEVSTVVYKDFSEKPEEAPKADREGDVSTVVYRDPLEKPEETQKADGKDAEASTKKYEDASEKREEAQKAEDATEKRVEGQKADREAGEVSTVVYKDPLEKREETQKADGGVAEVSTVLYKDNLDKPDEAHKSDRESAKEPIIINHNTPEILDETAQKLTHLQKENFMSTAASHENDLKANGPCGLVKLDPIAEELELKPHEVTEKTPERKDIPTKTYDRSVESAPQNAVTNGSSVPAAKPPYIIEDIHKTIEDINQLPPPPELPTGGLAKHVESVIIGEGVVKYVTGSLVLPNGTVLVTDEEEGIILFDTQGNIVNRIKNPAWRKPRSPIYYKEHVLMLLDIEEGQSNWCRYIFKFTVDLKYVAKIEGPKWMRDVTVISERLSIAHTDYMYLSVCGEIFSALYELTPVGQWTELQYRLSESYTDMLAFAVIGPITQVLVVEGNKHYVLMFSVRDSEVVDRRRIAICERPGALARDEAGRLFVANRASAAIQLVDTVRWAAAKNVALADAIVPHFSASWGLLAIPLKGAIRLHRYSFRFGVNR